jgi:elongation factor Tu
MTIGHQGHGKSTLTAALCTVLAKRYGEVAGDFGNDDQTQVSYATAN